MEHLSINVIQEYLNGRVNPEVEGHLATCEKCHKVYTGLKSLEGPLSQSFRSEAATASCPEDWEIGAFIKEGLAKEATEKIASHIKECGFCLDRAVVYYKALAVDNVVLKTPASWREKALWTLRAESRERVSVFERVTAFFRGIGDLRPLPGYAMATAVLIALLVVVLMPNKDNLVTIISTETLTVRDSEVPSALGFTGAGETTEVKNMEISLYQDRKVVFKWKPVHGSKGYGFSLIDKAANKTVMVSPSLSAPAAVVNMDVFGKNRLYGWIITGHTDDGRYFEYRGEFVLAK